MIYVTYINKQECSDSSKYEQRKVKEINYFGYIKVPFLSNSVHFGVDLIILNRSMMTRTTLKLALSSPNFRTTPAGGRLTYVRFGMHQGHKQGGSSVGSGCGPGALRFRRRDLTTRSPRTGN
ncbi:hypothetical protein AVEN_201088-1 [Araneus ventricosus]|uniref:Uncharacterized protein n=1 Tax=Araneus ventricosus TaxID=182803 RepID=A0A4Y2FUL0_ARAVE|nr:hypothetical protein AVEN_201088-1 [Araneus ventricosus]